MVQGRKRHDGPLVVTSVRIPATDWQWVKDKRLEFSTLLRIKIAELRAEMNALNPTFDDTPAGRFREWIADKNKANAPVSEEEMRAKRLELGLL